MPNKMRYLQEFLIEIREYLIRYKTKTFQTILLLRSLEIILNSNEMHFDMFIDIFVKSKNDYKFLRNNQFWKKEILSLNERKAHFIIDYIIERPKTSLLNRLFESILKLNNIDLYYLTI